MFATLIGKPHRSQPRDWLCSIFCSDDALLEIRASHRNIPPIMSDNRCYRELTARAKCACAMEFAKNLSGVSVQHPRVSRRGQPCGTSLCPVGRPTNFCHRQFEKSSTARRSPQRAARGVQVFNTRGYAFSMPLRRTMLRFCIYALDEISVVAVCVFLFAKIGVNEGYGMFRQ